jgi:hypothetical protein
MLESLLISLFQQLLCLRTMLFPQAGLKLVWTSPNPNPMSAKLHRFATKIAVRDSFALGLEQFESK